VAMNPILIKPSGHRHSQVIVMGKPYGDADARSYQAMKSELRPVVAAALADLRSRFDVVVCEGAGSPAEINLRAHDLTNMWLAREADLPVLVVVTWQPEDAGRLRALRAAVAEASDAGFAEVIEPAPLALADVTELLARAGLPDVPQFTSPLAAPLRTQRLRHQKRSRTQQPRMQNAACPIQIQGRPHIDLASSLGISLSSSG